MLGHLVRSSYRARPLVRSSYRARPLVRPSYRARPPVFVFEFVLFPELDREEGLRKLCLFYATFLLLFAPFSSFLDK